MWEYLLPSLINIFSPFNLFLLIAGIAGGIIIGALPGLTATMGVALMVPVTFAMNPISGLIMLGGIYQGAIYGGSNSAILINTPGTPSSVATTFDGWPMTQKGKAPEALNTALVGSAFGGIVGAIFLLLLAGPLARFSLMFGAAEFFWLCIFGLSTIAAMSQNNIAKGLVAAALGMLVATIGLDPVGGAPRFTFGNYSLVQGIEVIPAMIGLFSFSQVIRLVGSSNENIASYTQEKGVIFRVLRYVFLKCKANLLRSSLIGTIIGILPGAGGEIASIISYNEGKRWDKNRSQYGKGCMEGVVASETANNAVIGGGLIPMLTLGIPGSAVAAIIMGALLAHGIVPGFKIFETNGELAYTFINSLIIGNLLMIVIGAILVKGIAKVLNIPTPYIGVAIIALAAIGSYAIRNSMLDVVVMLFFGLIGYLGDRIGLDVGTMALGIILGPIVEDNFTKAIALGTADGSVLGGFFGSTISVILIILTLASVFSPYLIGKRLAKKGANQND